MRAAEKGRENGFCGWGAEPPALRENLPLRRRGHPLLRRLLQICLLMLMPMLLMPMLLMLMLQFVLLLVLLMAAKRKRGRK